MCIFFFFPHSLKRPLPSFQAESERPSLIFRSLPPTSLKLRRDFSGSRRAALRGLGGTRPAPLTQWPEPITKGTGAPRASRRPPFPARAPSTASGKEGRRRDVLATQILGSPPASSLNKKAGAAVRCKGSFELQCPRDPEIPASAAFICFWSKRGKPRMVEAFCATWKLTDSQNFDEYMKALGR